MKIKLIIMLFVLSISCFVVSSNINAKQTNGVIQYYDDHVGTSTTTSETVQHTTDSLESQSNTSDPKMENAKKKLLGQFNEQVNSIMALLGMIFLFLSIYILRKQRRK